MGPKLNNLRQAFSDTKMRGVFITLGLIVVILLAVAYVHLKGGRGAEGAGAVASVAGAPGIKSVPGAGEAPREYVKLQEQQNVMLSEEAARKGTAAIPTLTRVTYLEGGIGSDLETGCGAEELKRARNAGVTAAELRCRGCSLVALRNSGFTAGELRNAGFGAQDLKDAGYSAEELRTAGFGVSELIKAGFDTKDLARAGFSAGDLKGVGASVEDLKNAGFNLQQLKDAGFKVKDLIRGGFGASDLVAVGFDASELKEAGFTDDALKAAGFSDQEIKAAGKNCSVSVLRGLRAKGISSSALKSMGCSIAALKAAGFTAAELKAAGYSAKDLRDAGYSLQELKAAGFGAKELRDAGFSAQELKDAGFSAQELKDAGFSAGDLKQAGFSADDLKKAGFGAQELRNAGFGADELGKAGFSSQELKDAGFSEGDLVRAGVSSQSLLTGNGGASKVATVPVTAKSCSPSDISSAKAQGVSAKELVDRGCSLAALRASGYPLAELKAAGFSAKDLKDIGLTAGELSQAGFSPGEIVAAMQPEGAANTLSVMSTPPQQDWFSKLQTLREQQAKQLSAQEYKDKIRSMQQGMTTQANELFSSWIPLPSQQYVQGSGGDDKRVGQAVGVVAGQVGGKQQPAGGSVGPVDVFKAGDIMFATLDTGVNSDERSPVMATIIGGPLKGAKVLGNFQRADKKVVLQFNVLSVPYLTNSLPVNAVAIDPNTAKTALATKVNNHYMLRYGTIFASSFMSGIGQAVQDSANSVSINSSTGENINFHGSMTATKAAVVGLGEVGNKMSSVLSPVANMPPTVEVRAGSSIGLLLMADLNVPKKSE